MNTLRLIAPWLLLLWGVVAENPWMFATGALLILLDKLDEL